MKGNGCPRVLALLCGVPADFRRSFGGRVTPALGEMASAFVVRPEPSSQGEGGGGVAPPGLPGAPPKRPANRARH